MQTFPGGRKASLRTSLGERNSTRATDMRRDSLFATVDKDGSGTIDRAEFGQLYDVVKEQAEKDALDKVTAERSATTNKRRFKLMTCIALCIFTLLGLSMAGNFVMMSYVVESSKDTRATNNGLVQVKGTADIATTSQTLVAAPLFVAPVLDHSMDNVKSVTVRYLPEGGLHMVSHTFQIMGFTRHSRTAVEMVGFDTNTRLIYASGVSVLVKDGAIHALCDASVDSSPFAVPEATLDDYIDKAIIELGKVGVNVSVVTPAAEAESGRRQLEACDAPAWGDDPRTERRGLLGVNWKCSWDKFMANECEFLSAKQAGQWCKAAMKLSPKLRPFAKKAGKACKTAFKLGKKIKDAYFEAYPEGEDPSGGKGSVAPEGPGGPGREGRHLQEAEPDRTTFTFDISVAPGTAHELTTILNRTTHGKQMPFIVSPCQLC